jgi:hypothetical protein
MKAQRAAGYRSPAGLIPAGRSDLLEDIYVLGECARKGEGERRVMSLSGGRGVGDKEWRWKRGRGGADKDVKVDYT